MAIEKQKDQTWQVPPTAAPDQPTADARYRVKPGAKFYRPVGPDGLMEKVPEGTEIPLTETQALSFKDLFEKV